VDQELTRIKYVVDPKVMAIFLLMLPDIQFKMIILLKKGGVMELE